MTQVDLSTLLSKLDSTAWAAIIAAATSILSLAVTIIVNSRGERRIAMRQSLQDSLNQVGGLLYRIVATSQKMTDMRTDVTFQTARKVADKCCIELDARSREIRYALWGIDEGFRTMRMIPNYIANLKAERTGPRAARVIELSTELRISIDNSIRKAYRNGTVPSCTSRFTVWWKQQRLKDYFAKCKPMPPQQLRLPKSELGHRFSP